MKRFLSILMIAVLLFAALGCTGGLSCCAKSQVPIAPENASFQLAYDDESIKALLAYYQANTGYQPNYKSVTAADEGAEADPVANAATACVAVLKDEANAAVLEQAGWTRATVDNPFSLIVLTAPSGSAAAPNDNAVSALKVWLGGAEAKYLSEHPDLLK